MTTLFMHHYYIPKVDYGHTYITNFHEEFDNADYIFYMDKENEYSLKRQIDDYKSILYPINKWTSSINEIEDPWYTGRYSLVCDEIEECIKDIFAKI